MEEHLGRSSQLPAALQLLGRKQPEVRCSPWGEVTNTDGVHAREQGSSAER